MNSIILTLWAPGRNDTVSTPIDTITEASLCWNGRILLFRSSSELIVHRHWERTEKHFLSIIVTKLECTRQHEASQTADWQTDRHTQTQTQTTDNRQKGSVCVGVVCGLW